MHVRLATDWIRRLATDEEQDELVRWGREAVTRIERFQSREPGDVRFSFTSDPGRRA